jgi:hypothetical protein
MKLWHPRFGGSALCLIVAMIAVNSRSDTPVIITPETQQMMATAKQQGQGIADAMATKDFAKIIDLTYPPVLQVMGGKEKALEIIKASLESADAKIKLKTTKVGDAIELIDTGSTAYIVLPETMELDTPDGPGRSEGCLLAISDDRGKTWTYVDGAPGEQAIRKLLPGLPDTLKIPKHLNLAMGSATAKPTTQTAVPEEAAAEKWAARFKGKTEDEAISILGKESSRAEWKSGNYSGPKLVFAVGEGGRLALMFYDGHVMAALLSVDPK